MSTDPQFKTAFASAARENSRDHRFTTPGLDLREIEFRAWIDGTAKPDKLVVTNGTRSEVPLAHALRSLLASDAPLAPARGHALGLDDDESLATAAALLLHACIDPEGPRCRSFRAASYYLVGLAKLEADTDGNQAADDGRTNGAAPSRDAAPRQQHG